MAQALYYTEGNAPHLMDVLKKNANGTVDIGEDNLPIVTNCPVVQAPANGSCTLAEDAPKPKKPKSDDKQPDKQPE